MGPTLPCHPHDSRSRRVRCAVKGVRLPRCRAGGLGAVFTDRYSGGDRIGRTARHGEVALERLPSSLVDSRLGTRSAEWQPESLTPLPNPAGPQAAGVAREKQPDERRHPQRVPALGSALQAVPGIRPLTTCTGIRPLTTCTVAAPGPAPILSGE